MTQIHGVAILESIDDRFSRRPVHNLHPCAGCRPNSHPFRYDRKRCRTGAGMIVDLATVVLTISFAIVAYLIAIALWAVMLGF